MVVAYVLPHTNVKHISSKLYKSIHVLTETLLRETSTVCVFCLNEIFFVASSDFYML